MTAASSSRSIKRSYKAAVPSKLYKGYSKRAFFSDGVAPATVSVWGGMGGPLSCLRGGGSFGPVQGVMYRDATPPLVGIVTLNTSLTA